MNERLRERAFGAENGPVEAFPLATMPRQCWQLIAGALATLRTLNPRAVADRLRGDHAAFADPRLGPVADRVRALASALARLIATGSPAANAPLEAAFRELDTALAAIPGLSFEQIEPQVDAGTRDALALLREVGLEQDGVDITVAGLPGKGVAAARIKVSPLYADALLLIPVCERVFAWASADPLAEVELAASHWAFRGFAGPRDAGSPQAAEARLQRELEWMLCDRTMLAFGTSAMRAFLAATRRAEVPTRQRALCRALADSFAGVFWVRRRRDEIAVLEDFDGPLRYEVREYNKRIPYGPNDYGLGRLVPLSSGRFMRSLGFVFLRPDSAGRTRIDLERIEPFVVGGVDRALALEAFLWTHAGATVVPDHSPPAESAADAQQGLEVARLRMGGREGEADAVLQMWLAALERQAQGG